MFRGPQSLARAHSERVMVDEAERMSARDGSGRRRKHSGRTSHSDNGFDLSGDVARGLVFPRPHYCPPCLEETPICIGVAQSIPFDLCHPVLRISDSPWTPVNRAAMPKASINVDRDLRAAEDNVCPTPKTFEGRAVDPITEARRV
jgi:hypothetical protein